MKQIWRCRRETEKNISLAFVLKLNQPAELLKTAASGSYRIFADGQLLFKGPLRGAHGQSYIVSLPIPTGCKVIVAEVCHAGIHSYSEVSEQPFFAAEVFHKGVLIADSKDFSAYRLTDRLQKVQRYSFQRTFVESYRMQRDRAALFSDDIPFPKEKTVTCIANKLAECPLSLPKLRPIRGYKSETGNIKRGEAPYVFADRALEGAGRGTIGGFKPGELEEALSDELCAIHYYKNNGCEADSDFYELYDFGKEIAGLPKISLNVGKEADVYLTFDEILWEECPSAAILGVFHDGAAPLVFHRMGTVSGVKFRLAPGDYDLLCAEPYAFRWLKVSVFGGPVSIRSVGAIRYENADVSEQRSFLEGELAEILDAAKRTFAHNAVDVPTDCPSRERAGWLCDSYFTGKAELWLTGQNKTEKNFLQAFCQNGGFEYLPKGMLPMCYPADHPDGVFIPNWAMWYVLELKEYTERSGDCALAEQSRETVLSLIGYFKKFQNDDGLLENLENWVFIEWSRANDYISGINYPSNMLYAEMLNAAAQLYDLEEYAVQSAALKERIREQAFDGTWFRDHAVRDEAGKRRCCKDISETCQYYAFYFGIADPTRDRALFERLFIEITPQRKEEELYPELAKSNSFIGNTLRFDLLAKMRRYEQLLNETHDYFLPMARRTGTLWEHSGVQASCDHGFASIAAVWVLQAITGVCSIDSRSRTVAVTEQYHQPLQNYSVWIPVQGEQIGVTVRNGKRSLLLPHGYHLVTIASDL